MNKSSVKTWLSRNGYVPVGFGSNKRNCMLRASFRKSGRLFRVRREKSMAGIEWVIDVGEPLETFDRWANSTITTIPFEFFIANGWRFDAGICGNGKLNVTTTNLV